ncbi:hypothetical protein EVAR_32271_1 [Eumeta japonica]|uniref:Uncharacterized protein n=1 Tax=Eumeta variegata TaxID=151549 RepID=A0A4C1WYF8_EUMVA|nr:hypothetical protein EVAR_32271_1 [Eumeta japonica]
MRQRLPPVPTPTDKGVEAYERTNAFTENMENSWPRSFVCNVCSSYVQADAPSTNCSHFGAYVSVRLQQPYVKLALNILSLKSTLFIISDHTARKPYSEATKKRSEVWAYAAIAISP